MNRRVEILDIQEFDSSDEQVDHQSGINAGQDGSYKGVGKHVLFSTSMWILSCERQLDSKAMMVNENETHFNPTKSELWGKSTLR